MLRGEKNLLRVACFISSYMITRLRSQIVDLLHLDRNTYPSAPLAEQAGTPPPILRALDAKGVKTTFLYGSYDAGLDLLESYFGKLGARLSRYPSVRVVTFSDVDHSLFISTCLGQVIGLCENAVSVFEQHASVSFYYWRGPRKPTLLDVGLVDPLSFELLT